MAHDAGGRRLGSRRPARPRHAGLSRLCLPLPPAAKKRRAGAAASRTHLRRPDRRFLNLAAGRAGASGRRKLNLVDWDGDGDLDLVSDGPDGPVWYENIGTQQKPVMQLRGNLLKTKMTGPQSDALCRRLERRRQARRDRGHAGRLLLLFRPELHQCQCTMTSPACGAHKKRLGGTRNGNWPRISPGIDVPRALNRKRGTSHASEYEELRVALDDARAKCTEARLAIVRHTAEHGC